MHMQIFMLKDSSRRATEQLFFLKKLSELRLLWISFQLYAHLELENTTNISSPRPITLFLSSLFDLLFFFFFKIWVFFCLSAMSGKIKPFPLIEILK